MGQCIVKYLRIILLCLCAWPCHAATNTTGKGLLVDTNGVLSQWPLYHTNNASSNAVATVGQIESARTNAIGTNVVAGVLTFFLSGATLSNLNITGNFTPTNGFVGRSISGVLNYWPLYESSTDESNKLATLGDTFMTGSSVLIDGGEADSTFTNSFPIKGGDAKYAASSGYATNAGYASLSATGVVYCSGAVITQSLNLAAGNWYFYTNAFTVSPVLVLSNYVAGGFANVTMFPTSSVTLAIVSNGATTNWIGASLIGTITNTTELSVGCSRTSPSTNLVLVGVQN